MSTHILLAEDDDDIRAIAVLALRREGFGVTAVSDGADVLATIADRVPDAVVLDWMMPALDGPSTCRALRANTRTARLPVIFLTATNDAASIALMRDLGACGHLTKPFNPLQLGRQVRDLLDRVQPN